ncbi:three-helix bundle dimerization domain-containing protein [uncultured Amnibacterium sp.]|uniref:three-helix bundle dimerization domain-containing protein n=1 Tax=uncultured Amnibacterium sp. TaxID=1631851 RepID=UPI0035CAFDBB
MADELDVEQVVREVAASLQKTFPDKDLTQIEEVVRAQVEELRDRPVQDYVSVLAKRGAKKRLQTD